MIYGTLCRHGRFFIGFFSGGLFYWFFRRFFRRFFFQGFLFFSFSFYFLFQRGFFFLKLFFWGEREAGGEDIIISLVQWHETSGKLISDDGNETKYTFISEVTNVSFRCHLFIPSTPNPLLHNAGRVEVSCDK